MGIILNGILGGVSGKVAGVVGSSWKNKQYLRRYAMPANPNTTLQQAQRTKMAQGVAMGKAIVGPVFNKYVDKFEKGMSGFNRFIKENMAQFTTPITFGSVFLTRGKLWALQGANATSSVHAIHIGFQGTNLGANGASTDHTYAAAIDNATGLWYFPSAESTRAASAITITPGAALDGHIFTAYAWAAKYSLSSPTLLEMISDSVAVTYITLQA